MNRGKGYQAAAADLRASVGALLRIALELESDLRRVEGEGAEDEQDAVAERIGDVVHVLKLAGPGATTRRARPLWNAQAKLNDAANAVRAREPARVIHGLLGQAEAMVREVAVEMGEARARGESRATAFLHATEGVRVAADMIGRILMSTARWSIEGVPTPPHVAPVVPLVPRHRGGR